MLHSQATILLLVLPLPQFVFLHVLGAMQVLLVSPPEADTRLCTISEKFGLLEVGTEALFIAMFFSSIDGKTWTDAGASGDWSARNNHTAIAFGGKLSVM